jgi:hypothetical protein
VSWACCSRGTTMNRPVGRRVNSGARAAMIRPASPSREVYRAGDRFRAAAAEIDVPFRENLTRFPVDFRSRYVLRARQPTAGFSAFDNDGGAGAHHVAGSLRRRPAWTSGGPDGSERTVMRPTTGDGDTDRSARRRWTEPGRERRTGHSRRALRGRARSPSRLRRFLWELLPLRLIMTRFRREFRRA